MRNNKNSSKREVYGDIGLLWGKNKHFKISNLTPKGTRKQRKIKAQS